MTDSPPTPRDPGWVDDPRTGWWALGSVVAATLATGLHPLVGLAVPPGTYLVARAGTPRVVTAGTFGSAVALGPVYLGNAWSDAAAWSAVTAAAVLLGLLPWLVGRHVRDRRTLERTEADLTRSLEQRQWELAERTRARERTRIAREMHDTLGHQLSLIALRAGALEVGVGSTSPEQSQAAEELRSAVTRAASQLNRVVGLLTDEAEPAPLVPHPAGLDDLVRQASDAGMDVTLEHSGPDLEAVSQLTAQAVLRLVQEGLTNAAKHAPGATVEVRVIHHTGDGGEVEVRIVNSGGPWSTTGTVGAATGGSGLVALTDRVEYLGGQLQVKPTPDGFELTARLPASPDPASGERGDHHGPDGLPEELLLRRRRTQRSLASVVVAPLAALLVITVGFTSYFTYVTIASVLTPQEFRGIEVGDPQTEVEEVLPPVEMLEPPTDRLSPPDEADAQCRFYEGEVSFFERRRVYRICFADGEVVATDVIAPETLGTDR